MGGCFAPDCNHSSTSNGCKPFRQFPNKVRNKSEYSRWVKLVRRQDKEPTKNSRLCNCHFPNGRAGGPTLFKRNKDKLFVESSCVKPPPKKRKVELPLCTIITIPVLKSPVQLQTTETVVLEDVLEGSSDDMLQDESPASDSDTDENLQKKKDEAMTKTELTLLQYEIQEKNKRIQELELELNYAKVRFSAGKLNDTEIKNETGLPDKATFSVIVDQVRKYEGQIKYLHHNVKNVKLEDQILLTLMKMKLNHTHQHLATIFDISLSTVRNIVVTFVDVLHQLLYDDTFSEIPSRQKNAKNLPASFSGSFTNCKIIIDCTDVKTNAPRLLKHQKSVYSMYRGMYSMKMLLGVAPNGVITYISPLYPGSVSDKAIVTHAKSKFLDKLEPGDMVLADKGFLIHDVLEERGVSLNIPPFVTNGYLTLQQLRECKRIARARIHVERANARLKAFKILSCISPYMRPYADKIVQLCCALVNLGAPLIQETAEAFMEDIVD